ncbi:ATP-dependent zinc metalloprotease FtsH [Eubacterium ventriosum]|jgi:cell division protease FtsH|uniref:ATP-dependent zinc metalloprotease FtsH n=3 Tax=root TaxID=1 RepID=A5Z5P0_9FIRM|nr:ATP-dependent zinc metalloprotease FtsH [Eubacterium ventriosum]EDM51715.1 ATP-dependent metallopeptidase HflB [Eubacterium ventriosum ATCC 27560]MBS5016749.1 ATP-dependent zinc metalloprotease FtsH [Eubacterium ventriosum]MCC2790333.1 ATP-dependent zinc metalloprotease FtsH [Eubacterium ventriosum]UWP37189.1 ATP-dependent zinc metalloprotease FtsH [Eubacterium ventriosum]
MAIIIIVMLYYAGSGLKSNNYKYNDLLNDLQNGKVTQLNISQNKEVPTGKVTVKLQDGSTKYVYITDVNQVISDIKDINDKTNQNIQPGIADVRRDSVFLTNILPMLLMGVVIVVVIMMMNANAAGGNSKMANFGKSRAKMVVEVKNMDFSKVAGLKEEKEELEEIVDFLKNPNKYIMLGARIPKGILLEGPPGTGKTLLAKATAGEAGVPFFTISGSDFVEMFVGVGASRVRDLFAEAKKNAPCIIFIDEIDAVARRRGTGMGGGHDEREQTLNQMLVEMDGFGVNEGIIVMAATNRVDILDPAILRPGRFDRKVLVGRPDVKGRKEILEVHAKNKPIGDDVDLEQIARITSGFTGADLENLLNEASILAAKAGKHFLTQAEINQAMIKVGIGKEKKSRIISEKEKRITAYHESGHAILFHVLPDVGPVHTVSVIPTGAGAAGYTMPLPGKDEMFLTKGKMLQEIMVDLGGRIAEELILDDITTGASQDIKQATATAKSMVTKYGFSDKLGLINYDDESDDVFIGRDLAHSKGYGENTASVIDEEVREIVDTCYKKAKKIIEDHMEQLHASAALLMEKEKIGREEFESLFDADNNQADSLTNEETV